MVTTATRSRFSSQESTSPENLPWLLTQIILFAWSVNSQRRSRGLLPPLCPYGGDGAPKGWCTQIADRDLRSLKQHPLQTQVIAPYLYPPSRAITTNAYLFAITLCVGEVPSSKLLGRVLVRMTSGITTLEVIPPIPRALRAYRVGTATHRTWWFTIYPWSVSRS